MSMHALPYHDREIGHTSGHSGSASSKARAHAQDLSGKTKSESEIALEWLSQRQELGATARELGGYTGLEHQTYSSVMSNLHKTGRVVRLLEQRKGSEVYVLPEYVSGRPRSEYRPNAAARKMAELLSMVDRAEEAGATAILVTALRRVLS